MARKVKPSIYPIDLEIRKRRESLGMDQQSLAFLAGISKMTLSDIEAGVSVNPSVYTMYKIGKALNCTIEDLLSVDKEC